MKAKIEWILILIAHLVLLKWIYYLLSDAGTMEMEQVGMHFTGISFYGFALIRYCAWTHKKKYLKEIGRE